MLIVSHRRGEFSDRDGSFSCSSHRRRDYTEVIVFREDCVVAEWLWVLSGAAPVEKWCSETDPFLRLVIWSRGSMSKNKSPHPYADYHF